MKNVDGLLISGGGDVDPARYGGDSADPTLSWVNTVRDDNETRAFDVAWSRGLPTLAICRGAQLINAVRGGTLYTDLERDHPSDIAHRLGEEALTGVAHQVDVVAGSRVAGWIGRSGDVAVNSQHHQGIRALARDFTATAHAPDNLVEAFESQHPPVTAVQWHPEINWETDEASQALMRAFVMSCQEHAVSSAPVALAI
jgi:putative glutamine amidotransferase